MYEKDYYTFVLHAILTSAFAQINRHDADDINKNINSDWNSNTSKKSYQKDNDRDDRYRISQRDMQIQKITSQFDLKIQQVSYNRRLSRWEKKRAIETLQAQKAQQISRAYLSELLSLQTRYARYFTKSFFHSSSL